MSERSDAEQTVIPARPSAWLNAERIAVYPRLLVAVYVIVIIGWIFLAKGMIDRSGTPLGGDFISFYAAGQLARHGEAGDAYNPVVHGAAERAVTGQSPDTYFSWNYPPVFLLVASALATLPFLVAFVVWQGFTLGAFLLAMHRIVPRRETIWLTLAFPATFVNLIHGQTGFLSAALVAMFTLSVSQNPWWAGIALGLSSFKPHFALAMGLVALVTRRWIVLASATLTGGLLSLTAWWLFGSESWQAFLHSIPVTGRLMLEHGGPGWHKMIGIFAALRLWGMGSTPAMLVHISLATVACLLLSVVWLRPGVEEQPDERAVAALAVATLLLTPYALDYDLVISGVAIAWLARLALRQTLSRRGELMLTVAFVSPFVARPLAALGVPVTAFTIPALFLFIWYWPLTAHSPATPLHDS